MNVYLYTVCGSDDDIVFSIIPKFVLFSLLPQ